MLIYISEQKKDGSICELTVAIAVMKEEDEIKDIIQENTAFLEGILEYFKSQEVEVSEGGRRFNIKVHGPTLPS
ncbi:hypothetical protein [Oceanobacillus caeni]|uniref:hypothetical protein n=1 Tax=Oceanobacillus caeni TaxID=405946 RepID=UPI002E1B7A71|nr:hypothetical protein [Oceanobacillus caeni]